MSYIKICQKINDTGRSLLKILDKVELKMIRTEENSKFLNKI